MQDHIPDALIAAFERQYDASWNDPQLRNERLAMRYGWAAAIEQKQKQCLFQIQEPAPVPAAPPASQRDELLQVALDFIGTLTGMSPPPIEVAPPEVFAPFLAFVDRVQAITAPQAQADALDAAPAASEQDAPQQDLYYLQDARWSAMVGNCPSWWRPDGNGYTTNLDEAARFTFAEAMAQHQCRNTDLPWLCLEVDKLRRPTVNCQQMPRSWDEQRADIAAHAAQVAADSKL